MARALCVLMSTSLAVLLVAAVAISAEGQRRAATQDRKGATSGPPLVAHPDRRSNSDVSQARAAIRARIASYVEAFNKRDAQALAAHWHPDAVYVNPITGDVVRGRQAIAAEFEKLFRDIGNARLRVVVHRIGLLSPNVAVEEGNAFLHENDKLLGQTHYRAIHVRVDGTWYLDRVSERDVPAASSYRNGLHELQWLIGRWVDDSEPGAHVWARYEWSRDRAFLVHWFDVEVDGTIDLSGIQLIGWDPIRKQIRSWVFDSDGGFAESWWTKRRGKWFIVTVGTTPEGAKVTSTHVLTPVDERTFRWKAVDRTIDGVPLPNVEEITVRRAD